MASPTQISKFFGLNESDSGETQLRLGESPLMNNYRVTNDYKLKTREGYIEQFNTLGAHNVRGMWYGKLANAYHFLFACNGVLYAKDAISGTDYDSLDAATYTNVDAVKTTAYAAAVAGTTGIDGYTIYQNSAGTDLTEIAQADIDLAASVGKYYYHTDKTIWIVVAKGAYADIAAARTGLGTTTAYYRLGTLTDADTHFFSMDDKLYIQNGAEYKSWNGTTLADVAGYIPVVAIATPPAGGGTAYEQINLLTGKKWQWFSGDAAATAYQLAETGLDSVDVVKVNGTVKTVTTDYTVNLTTGVVTFVAAPDAAAANNVQIQWTNDNAANRTKVLKNKASMLYGGSNDTRVHMWGNPDYKNRRFTSGIPYDGSTSAEYLPVNMNADIGSFEFAITDIVRQYDRQIILKERGAHYSYYEITSGVSSFPVYPLNDNIGNVAFNQAQLVQNNPFSVFTGAYEWTSTTVRDERNARYISKKVQPSMDDVDLATAKTIDWEENGEFWLCVGTTVWVCNYRLSYMDENGVPSYVWSKFTLTDTPTCFLVIDGDLYFGTTAGQVMKFDPAKRTDNGTAFTRTWESHFYDFEDETKRKFANRLWLSLKPESKTRVQIKYQTDKSGYSDTLEAYYNLATFEHADFSNWSFSTNYNPQPFRFKIRAKKFAYFKIILWNDSATEIETILSINLLARMGGEVK